MESQEVVSRLKTINSDISAAISDALVGEIDSVEDYARMAREKLQRLEGDLRE